MKTRSKYTPGADEVETDPLGLDIEDSEDPETDEAQTMEELWEELSSLPSETPGAIHGFETLCSREHE